MLPRIDSLLTITDSLSQSSTVPFYCPHAFVISCDFPILALSQARASIKDPVSCRCHMSAQYLRVYQIPTTFMSPTRVCCHTPSFSLRYLQLLGIELASRLQTYHDTFRNYVVRSKRDILPPRSHMLTYMYI